MAQTLKFNLNSQSKISQEGMLSKKSRPMPVGQRQIDFSIPNYDPKIGKDVIAQNTPKAQRIVDRINQYIENISDDYFLLGMHLIALHKLLKQSKLKTDQIKAWYVENINMPYTSAMQCKKVAEVYADNPQLINRYSASGAYLLSSYNCHEEREAIWLEACGEKATASIRELRYVLKKRQQSAALSFIENPHDSRFYKIGEIEIYQVLEKLSRDARKLRYCTDPNERLERRRHLIREIRELLRQI